MSGFYICSILYKGLKLLSTCFSILKGTVFRECLYTRSSLNDINAV